MFSYHLFKSIWIATAIFTFIPNVILVYKWMKGVKIGELIGSNFVHFISVLLFVAISFAYVTSIIFNYLEGNPL